MVVCSVPGCAGKGTRMFHSFPKNPEVRQIWVRNTKTFLLTEKQLNSYGKVCKYHFNESDFEINARNQQGLKKNAIPTVHLPEDLMFGDEQNYVHVKLTELKFNFDRFSYHIYRRRRIDLFLAKDVKSHKKMKKFHFLRTVVQILNIMTLCLTLLICMKSLWLIRIKLLMSMLPKSKSMRKLRKITKYWSKKSKSENEL